jgi:cyclopropane fatty-acyl-phospholipid synthase-like methyltransferase
MTIQMILPIFEFVIFISERAPIVVAVFIVLASMVRKSLRYYVALAPVVTFLGLCALVLWESNKMAAEQGFDMSKPTLREALEDYINHDKGDLIDILEGGVYAPVFGKVEMNRYLGTWLAGTWLHNTHQDAEYLPEAYNKGDDWFEATLGEPMVYTGAIYSGPNDTMWSAQLNKLDFIAHALGAKPGDRALEIGCGWGRLSNHLASKGATVTGVTMSKDQQAYGQRMSKALNNKVDIKLVNFFDLDVPDKHYNVISSVEMAEHVGIQNYNKFLKKVHKIMADDGTFYLQVAGLPRGYGEGYNHYEDLVWGMFMDEHVFPGADASCPMGWVLTHLEQAGFEVQSSLNLGNHYSKTLHHWQLLWEQKKDIIEKAYGERSYRRWRVFLAWSVRIARRGGSTVHFITSTKSGQEKARIAAQDRLAPGNFQLPAWTASSPGGGPAATKGF